MNLSEYPYIVKVGSLRAFLTGIPGTGEPPKVTTEYIESLGFKSKNDRPILTILKFVNFLDQEGQPTDYYRLYRDKGKNRAVMADCIRKAYPDLFSTFPDAYNKDSEALRNFFSSKMKGGEAVLVNAVNTFKALCEFADFDAPSILEIATKAPPGQQKSLGTPVIHPSLHVNLSIEIQLPVTENPEIYDKIFQSLRKNIIERPE